MPSYARSQSPVYMPTTSERSPTPGTSSPRPTSPPPLDPNAISHNYVIVFQRQTFCSARQLQNALRRAKKPAIVSSIYNDREYMLIFDLPMVAREVEGIIMRAFGVDADMFTTVPFIDADDIRLEGGQFVDVAKSIVVMRDTIRDLADENRQLRRELIRANASADALRLSLARARKMRKIRA